MCKDYLDWQFLMNLVVFCLFLYAHACTLNMCQSSDWDLDLSIKCKYVCKIISFHW